ncbi:MAG TPA: hypothetical protein IAB03_10135 [Candidatus Gallibacteroides avistercoris]|uniref:Uncharacterized protein n=1 Tax=Candidatus Gallibacteroides avistercoris TaxID=2840833 RepID=A0A9D1M9H2_9BACT|nr:hypothetical protein [Candidatus Gallibacteroides avistercoris]
MKNVQKSLCHLHYSWEDLVHEVYLQSSYAVKGYPDVDADALVLGEDESMLLARLLSDAYSSVFNRLSGFMKEGGGCLTVGSHIDFSLMIPDAIPAGVLESLSHLVKQLLVYYVLSLWFMGRNRELATNFLQLCDSVAEEVKSCLHRRLVPITRNSCWW